MEDDIQTGYEAAEAIDRAYFAAEIAEAERIQDVVQLHHAYDGIGAAVQSFARLAEEIVSHRAGVVCRALEGVVQYMHDQILDPNQRNPEAAGTFVATTACTPWHTYAETVADAYDINPYQI